jgi:hypothetical protein
MADLEDYLTSTDLLDCQGHVEHSLTLLVDGRVRVRRGTSTMTIDPDTGYVDPPGMTLPEHVLHAAGALVGRPIPSQNDHRRHR